MYAKVPHAVASTIGIKCRVSDAMSCSTLASANVGDHRAAGIRSPLANRAIGGSVCIALFVGHFWKEL